MIPQGTLAAVAEVDPVSGLLGAFSAFRNLPVAIEENTADAGPDVFSVTSDVATARFDGVGSASRDDLGGRITISQDAAGAVLVTPNGTALEFTRLAGWAEVDRSGAVPKTTSPVVFGAIGVPTAAAALPAGTTATYTGQSIGAVGSGTGFMLEGARVTTSDIAVTTDFATVSVSSTNTVVENSTDHVGTPNSGLDFTASGTVQGGGYSASAVGMTVNGIFYGPAAEETGGVFNGVLGGQEYGGSFGAARSGP